MHPDGGSATFLRTSQDSLAASTQRTDLPPGLEGVIAQVLVKRVCPKCATPLDETVGMILDPAVRQRLSGAMPPRLFQGAGCEYCFGTGYSGRMGIFELLAPDEAIKSMIFDRRPAGELEQAAARTQLTLEQVGKLAAVTGKTTMEEIIDKLPML